MRISAYISRHASRRIVGCRIGIDAGSKTIKVVILNETGDTVCSVYRRHRADIRTTLGEVLHNLIWRFGDMEGTIAITGSAGIALAELLGLPFVQEVEATTRAVEDAFPQADVIVELGGEDAKVVYLSGGLEQRMNATCAGGTGGFIDTIAFMLGARPQDMSRLALGANRLYPIASRCAVFAQTDVRPLLNAGARRSDIAASALEAVVRQTISGLACGRPIAGTVVFLGGPLEHIPELVHRFRRALKLSRETGIKPPDAHLFTAKGAAIASSDCGAGELPSVSSSLSQLERMLSEAGDLPDDLDRLPPLFADVSTRAAFEGRHASERMPRVRLFDCEGPLYLGIDAGSTTVKCALVDDAGRLAYSDYRPVEGDALRTACLMLADVYRALPRHWGRVEPNVYIAHATATGYGEELLRAGLQLDSGIVETSAHVRAARAFRPDVTFVLDIGGQDMKAIWVRDGQVSDAVLNEACSSGCGSFVEGTAHSLRSTPEHFAALALEAPRPVDLGTKCTVFMTSRVRHAQKVGASMADIAAGVAYSVVQNALFRIIGRDKAADMGDVVVVQGGAFKSDAVLRAFELVSGVDAVRPDTAHLMGAIGAALAARDRACAGASQPVRSSIVDEGRLAALSPKRTTERCTGCHNACALSVVEFEGLRRYIAGNRCNRAMALMGGFQCDEHNVAAQAPPNVVALERRLIGRIASCDGFGPRANMRVGILASFGLYEHLPFWHAFFCALGFSVAVPRAGQGGESDDEALATIPSESVCRSAKLAHVRFYDLVRQGSHAVFAPRLVRNGRCPVACGYIDALCDSVPATVQEDVYVASPLLQALRPQHIVADAQDRAALLACLTKLAPDGYAPNEGEVEHALTEALAAQRAFEGMVERGTERAFAWLSAAPGRHGAIMACRPYQVDGELSHGIDTELQRLGFAVLAPLGLARQARKARKDASLVDGLTGTWGPAKHAVGLAQLAATNPALELVCLQAFGCSYDAVSLTEARDIMARAGRQFTLVKIDDIADTAHIRIRLRTLAESLETGATPLSTESVDMSGLADRSTQLRAAASVVLQPSTEPVNAVSLLGSICRADVDRARRDVGPDICFTVAALVGRAAQLMDANPTLHRIAVPRVCKRCLLDALPQLVGHACGRVPDIVWQDSWPKAVTLPTTKDSEVERAPGVPRIGVVGNALLCFDAHMNDGLLDLLASLGCQAVLPDPANLFVDDVRYLTQLAVFAADGVDHVIYLQSFGCLKGHVQARGALHGLARLYPDMPVTVVDYDPQASALNRENRIRLAVSAARRFRRAKETEGQG